MTFLFYKRLQALIILFFLLLTIPVISQATGLNDLLSKKEVNEEERQETIEKIQSIQEKLKLLQDKLRVLERRKAAKAAAERAEEMGSKLSAPPTEVNWLPVDETTVNPGDYGLYTYLLFAGQQEDDFAALGLLEDFILTIETLPANDIPSGLANRFLVPVEKPQSIINLGRRPYNFNLNQAYLGRLAVSENLPPGPVLVSSTQVIDPFGSGELADHLIVALGKQPPEQSSKIASLWYQHESDTAGGTDHSVADLFWELLDEAGTVQVSRKNQRITVILPQ